MKIDITLDISDSVYHPNDKFEGLKSSCSGWEEAMKNPNFLSWAKEQDFINSPYKTNRDVYEEYLKLSPKNEYEIETIPAPHIGAVLLAFAEKLFIKAGEQASRGINTGETEENIKSIKESIILLSRFKEYQVAYIPLKPKMFDQTTKLNVLQSFPTEVKQHVSTDCGEIGLIYIKCPYFKDRMYIIIPPQKREINIQLGFDGKNFIALYPDNIKSLGLPDSIISNHIPLNPAPQELHKDPSIEERVHGDVVEHKHEGYDYWHPSTRIHA